MGNESRKHLDTSAATMVGVGLSSLTPAHDTKVGPPDSQIIIDVEAGTRVEASASTMSGIHQEGAAALPERIGNYRILRLIGAGGMGAVYEAEQDQPRRTVALKIMRGALASPQASRRFEYESQLLAKLRHPCIAQVYEAGTHSEPLTGSAVPFFAMEFIPGARELTAYADDLRLGLRQRIELFQQVCDAVQHGHQRGVIHRDLKPANILVDSAGCPKIIDFGVARASGDEQNARVTQHTSPGQLIGTLQYMSPEQCGPDSHDIDVRADVYALGVILFELLAGKPPYELEGKALFEAAMIVREDPPTRPSSIRRELKGDVETIILKALEKDRARRYDSAISLAADLTRFLRSEPILARHIGVAGKLARWVRRNRAVATVLAVSTAVLLTTSVVLIARIIAESHRANQALVVAQQNLTAANENLAFIRNIFSNMKPDAQKEGFVDVGKILDNASEGLAKQKVDNPEREADFRQFLGQAYIGVGRYEKATDYLKRALEIRESTSSAPDPRTAEALHFLAASLWWRGRYDEAEPLYRRSLAMRQALHKNSDHEDVALALTHLAACRVMQNDLEDGRRYYLQALSMREALSKGVPNAELAAAINNAAKILVLVGDYERAEPQLRRAMEMVKAKNGESDLQTASASINLGLCLLEMGRAKDALPYFEQASAARHDKLTAKHHYIAQADIALARARFKIEPTDAALRLAVDSFDALEKAQGHDHADVIDACGHLGLMLAQRGDHARAEELLRRAEKAFSSQQSSKRGRAESRARLALGLYYMGKETQAREILSDVFENSSRDLISPVLRADAAEALASIYESRGESQSAAVARSWSTLPPR